MYNKYNFDKNHSKITTELGYVTTEELKTCPFVIDVFKMQSSTQNPNYSQWLVSLNPLYGYYEAVDGINTWLKGKGSV